MSAGPPRSGHPISGNLRLGVLALVVGALLWTCVWQLDPEESGVVLRFGRVARTTSSGVTLTLPWPVERLEKVATSDVRTVEVGVPRRTDDVQLLSPEESLWLTGDTNILLAKLSVQYDVADPVAYLTRFAGTGEGDDVVRQATESIVTKLVAGWSIDDVLAARRSELQTRAQAELQRVLTDLGTGLRVQTVNVPTLAPPSSGGVSSAFRAVETERQNKQSLLDRTRAEARRSETDAHAEAQSTLAEATKWAERRTGAARAIAERFASLVAKADDPYLRRRLTTEARRKVLENAEVLRVPAGEHRIYLPLPRSKPKKRD